MNEVTAKIINSILAGVLVMLGGMSNGEMSTQTLYFSFVAGAIVAVTQFKTYFEKKQETKQTKPSPTLFNFVGF